MTSVQTMEVELATEVCRRDSNHTAKCTARNKPLSALSSTVFLVTCRSFRRTSRLPKTTGVMSRTVHNRRYAAVTAEGADEYLTKIEDKEMPITPMTIMIMGCFSRYFMDAAPNYPLWELK